MAWEARGKAKGKGCLTAATATSAAEGMGPANGKAKAV